MCAWHKCHFNFIGILEEERKENKQQADESAKQIKLLQGTSVCLWIGMFCCRYYKHLLIQTLNMVWTGQLQQLQDEIGILREQIDVSSSSHDELQRAREEAKVLKRALEAAAAERDRDVAAIQTNLSAASKDLDKWRQTASKYEREIDNLQRDLQQQSKQWQKTAEIQGIYMVPMHIMLQNMMIVVIVIVFSPTCLKLIFTLELGSSINLINN